MIVNSRELADLIYEGNRRPDENSFMVLPEPDLECMRREVSVTFDIHLGRWFAVPRSSAISHVDNDVQMSPAERRAMVRRQFVPFGREFVLHPGVFLLGATLEWLRFPSDLAGSIVGKSSWGRRGLVIETASAIHPNFSGCLTLEITNLGSIPIKLRPGTALGQVQVIRVPEAGGHSSGRFGCYRRPEIGPIEPDYLGSILKIGEKRDA